MELVKAVASYIGVHANKVRSAIWQLLLVAVVMRWVTLEEAQLAAWGMALDAILGLFVESNTVSRVRMGERITEERAKVVEAMSTGHYDPPPAA